MDRRQGRFGGRLDITRIDAGGFELDPIPVRLEELYARLRLSFEPAAFDKGLALRLIGGHHVVRADPLALERILRNPVSNALRYTDEGGALLCARPGGAQLLPQVWASGLRVPARTRPTLVDEVHPAPHQRPSGASQRRGEGRGWAHGRRAG